MSHTVTITRTTTTTNGTMLFLNSGYLSTTPGLLKLAQLLLGAACVGLVAYYMDHNYRYSYFNQKPELFFLLTAVAFLIGTFCLLASCICSLSTASIISKTLYEVIYHGLAFIMYLAAGLTLLIEVNHQKDRYRSYYEPYLAASLLGAACVGLVAYYMDHNYRYSYFNQKPELFFLLTAVAFLIGTFCLLASCICSLSTASIISKTLYEVIYHGLAFIMYLAAGLTLLIEVNHQKDRYRSYYEPYLAASIMGLVMAALYLLSTFFANRTYRGI